MLKYRGWLGVLLGVAGHISVLAASDSLDAVFRDYLEKIRTNQLPEVNEIHSDLNRFSKEYLKEEQAAQLWQLFLTMEDELTNPFKPSGPGSLRHGPGKIEGVLKEAAIARKVYAFNQLLMLLHPEDVRPIKTAFDWPGSVHPKEKFFAFRNMEIKRAQHLEKGIALGREVKLPHKRQPVNLKRMRPKPVYIDTTETRWHSTQVYANPGDVIVVKVPEEATKLGWKVRIGSSTCNNFRWRDEWVRWPLMFREKKITEKVTQLANVFGGMVYIDIPNDAKPGQKIKAFVAGGVPVPFYELGKTHPKRWTELERKLPAPFAELASEKLVITVRSELIRDLENPHEVMQYWQEVVDLQNELADREVPRYRERFSVDRQICVGYMHAGYPIMAPEGESQVNLFDLEYLRKDGHWGWFHELGHNHQTSAWRSPWRDMTEVTVNIFSAFTTEKMCNKGPDEVGWLKHRAAKLADSYYEGPQITKEVMQNEINDEIKGDYFGMALMPLIQLRKEFGWNLFRDTFTRYEKMGKENWPNTGEARADLWAKTLSQSARRNLVPFFESWGFKVSDSMKQEIAKLNLEPYQSNSWPTELIPPNREVPVLPRVNVERAPGPRRTKRSRR